MTALIWRAIAYIVTRPRIMNWLSQRAFRTPYSDITATNGEDIYMARWWLFNPYGRGEDGEQTDARWPWLPSIRLHHIMREDRDRHLHDHPWNARTIVLRGWYEEERPYSLCGDLTGFNFAKFHADSCQWRNVFTREAGYTGRLLFGQYHRISDVPFDGVWTLFFTWPKRGSWGFDVDGVKVNWREYFGVLPVEEPALDERFALTPVAETAFVLTGHNRAEVMELTDWFPREIPPAHTGYYQRKYRGFETDRFVQSPDWFDVECGQWFLGDGGDMHTSVRSGTALPWRGLAVKPEGVAS